MSKLERAIKKRNARIARRNRDISRELGYTVVFELYRARLRARYPEAELDARFHQLCSTNEKLREQIYETTDLMRRKPK